MRVLVYQCPAGISGDMNLGALVDLGLDPQALESELRKLGLEGWSLRFERDARGGISGTRCDVVLGEPAAAHSHGHDHGHSHDHDHGHGHRTFGDIRAMIEASALPAAVKEDAIAVFRVLAEAEAAVHGTTVDAVHFHEVGAVDSIIDMVGAAIGWHLLGIDAVHCGAVELGGGTVDCAHGRMPVPAPATARIVAGMPVTLNATDKEATTPTGAALLAGKGCIFNRPVGGRTVATGTGIGQRDDPDIANVLHVMLIESAEPAGPAQEVVELAANIDDMTPEHLAHACARLREAGALDVWQTPATFKKGRLGTVLSALCEPAEADAIEARIIAETTTLGVRRRNWSRTALQREERQCETAFGPVRVKFAFDADGAVLRAKPEFEDCRRIAERESLPVETVARKIRAEIDATRS